MATQFENESTAAISMLEKCREITNCPDGVDLQDHLRQLAAENVGLKLKGRELLNEASKVYQKYNATIDFYSGDFMDGQTLHEFQFVLDADAPATDRILAAAEARGVEKFAAEQRGVAERLQKRNVAVAERSISFCLESAEEAEVFAKQLREGAK